LFGNDLSEQPLHGHSNYIGKEKPVLIWLDERIGELAPINVQFAFSGSGIHDRGTPGISYA